MITIGDKVKRILYFLVFIFIFLIHVDIAFANTINSPDIYISELTPKMFLDFVIESIYEEENNFFMKKDLFDFICDFSPFMNKTFILEN